MTIDIQGNKLDFQDMNYWENVIKTQVPVRLRCDYLGILRVNMGLLKTVALPQNVCFEESSCSFVFACGRVFARNAHIVLARVCKQFTPEMWHVYYYVVKFQKLTCMIADHVAIDMSGMHI